MYLAPESSAQTSGQLRSSSEFQLSIKSMHQIQVNIKQKFFRFSCLYKRSRPSLSQDEAKPLALRWSDVDVENLGLLRVTRSIWHHVDRVYRKLSTGALTFLILLVAPSFHRGNQQHNDGGRDKCCGTFCRKTS
jgi:hypothetical protein